MGSHVIDQGAILGEAHTVGRGVGSQAAAGHEVEHRMAAHQDEMIGQRAAMATPPGYAGVTARLGAAGDVRRTMRP